jgi:CubicO group peptidase (beta-lactamase class C family)
MAASSFITRRVVARSILLGLPAAGVLGGHAGAEGKPAIIPGADWEKAASPEAAGFRSSGFEALEAQLVTLPTTAFMVVSGGRVTYTYGDVAQASDLGSARKSVLSMLFGKYVANGTINLDRTMADLGIDEADGLLPIEKTARIRDLLIASSGVYHAAGSPGDDPNTPPRGSKQPGTFFHYNNWDFNVLGAVFEKLSGKTVFQALDEELARPLQMQDFQLSRQRMMGFENQSRFLAYHLFLSARDMARLGLVMARGGDWNGRQVVPAAWVKESTEPHVPASSVGRGGELSYGQDGAVVGLFHGERPVRPVHPGSAGHRYRDRPSPRRDGRVRRGAQSRQDQVRAAARARPGFPQARRHGRGGEELVLLRLDVLVQPADQPGGDLEAVAVLHQHVRVALDADLRQHDQLGLAAGFFHRFGECAALF